MIHRTHDTQGSNWQATHCSRVRMGNAMQLATEDDWPPFALGNRPAPSAATLGRRMFWGTSAQTMTPSGHAARSSSCSRMLGSPRVVTVSTLKDLMWAVAVMVIGVLGMVLNYGTAMFWYAAILLVAGAAWALTIRIRKATSDPRA